MVCWGQNQFGQLGDGEATDEVAWPQVVDVQGATAASIAANSRHTCMVAEGGGSVWCWGRNEYGASAPTFLPELVVGPASDTAVVDPFDLDLGYDHTCSADAVGGLTCWGRNNAYQLGSMDVMPGPVSTGPHVATPLGLALGHHHGCLWDDAQVLCWGSNDNGQIGVLMPNRVDTPTVVAALPGGVVSVAAGTDHTCAAVDAGASVYCWGRNDVGQLGNTAGGMTYEPTLVPGDAGASVRELVARENTTCAWLDDDEIWCWGGVRGGSLGTDVRDDEVLVPPARVMVPEMDFETETIERLGIGSSHMCAVTDAMSLWCWGSDNQHQLGPVAPLPGASAVEVNLECPR